MPMDRVAWSKIPLLLLLLAPFGWLLYAAVSGGLSADPIKELTHQTGLWALRILLLTLAVTPLRLLTRQSWLIRYRRLLGLTAFFYVCVHFSIYVFLDLGLYWSDLLADIAKRPYITVGFTAFLLLIPLALTSTKSMMRRLGRRWVKLHRLIYLIAPLAVLHFLWQVKADTREPLIYGAILLALLVVRVPVLKRKLSRRGPRVAVQHKPTGSRERL